MSLRNTLRTIPTQFRIGFSEAIAYRAELFVWILATTLPLIMLALWTAVAREAPIGRFGEKDFVVYFLATFIVRQLTSAWAAFEMNYEVRQGTLAMRLLKPVHPLWTYAIINLAFIPARIVVAIPVAGIMLAVAGSGFLPATAVDWLLFLIGLAGAWLIAMLASIAIGTLSLYIESSLKVVDLYLSLFFVFSGYLVPIELFPGVLRQVTNFLPFRYQMGLPVELLTSALTRGEALRLLVGQWMWVAGLLALTSFLWRRGLRRFAAYGG